MQIRCSPSHDLHQLYDTLYDERTEISLLPLPFFLLVGCKEEEKYLYFLHFFFQSLPKHYKHMEAQGRQDDSGCLSVCSALVPPADCM